LALDNPDRDDLIPRVDGWSGVIEPIELEGKETHGRHRNRKARRGFRVWV